MNYVCCFSFIRDDGTLHITSAYKMIKELPINNDEQFINTNYLFNITIRDSVCTNLY